MRAGGAGPRSRRTETRRFPLRSDIETSLSQALKAKGFVRVQRSLRNADVVRGFVVALSPKWIVLHETGDAWLDGYSAIRIADIKKVENRPNDLTPRALALYGQRPRKPRGIDCADVRTLLTSVNARFPLTTIHAEAEHPDECYIGVIDSFTSRTVRLLEIDPRAEWDASPTSWPLAKITRVGFDGKYEQALFDLADRPG